MGLCQLVVEGPSAGVRLDLFLMEHLSRAAAFSAISRTGCQKLIREGLITVNGRKTKASVRLRADDLVRIETEPPRQCRLEPQALPLEILYEDKDCVVVNKAPGVLVHPAAGRSEGTLVNALLYHCQNLEGVGGERRPGIVHRLDKDTSGALIAAKNTFAFGALAAQFKDRRVAKEYFALVWGRMDGESGILNRPIGRHRSDRKRMSSRYALLNRRAALTEWRVERIFSINGDANTAPAVSLLRVRPHTGRTHQIRVHLADSGHPLVGDRVYGHKRKGHSDGGGKKNAVELFPRQALHALKLGILHPRSGEAMEFYAPLPADMKELLANLGENIGLEATKLR